MTMPDALELFNKLHELCQYGFTIEIDEHRQAHQTIEQWIATTDINVDSLIRFEMIERKTMIFIYAYPRNTHTQLYVAHYDLVMAMDQMIVQIQSYLAEHPGSV